jgi:hypothetical protein
VLVWVAVEEAVAVLVGVEVAVTDGPTASGLTTISGEPEMPASVTVPGDASSLGEASGLDSGVAAASVGKMTSELSPRISTGVGLESGVPLTGLPSTGEVLVAAVVATGDTVAVALAIGEGVS